MKEFVASSCIIAGVLLSFGLGLSINPQRLGTAPPVAPNTELKQQVREMSQSLYLLDTYIRTNEKRNRIKFGAKSRALDSSLGEMHTQLQTIEGHLQELRAKVDTLGPAP